MEISYSEINNRLLSYFLENKTFCGQIALTIDENEVKSLFPERDFGAIVKTIGSFWKTNCWQRSWKGKMSFAIIGLQGTAAYDYNGLSSESSIRSDLQRLLGFSTNDLTALFEGNSSKQGETFQGKLRNGAKTYL